MNFAVGETDPQFSKVINRILASLQFIVWSSKLQLLIALGIHTVVFERIGNRNHLLNHLLLKPSSFLASKIILLPEDIFEIPYLSDEPAARLGINRVKPGKGVMIEINKNICSILAASLCTHGIDEQGSVEGYYLAPEVGFICIPGRYCSSSTAH